MHTVKVFFSQLKRYVPMTGKTLTKIQQKDMLAQVFINQKLV